MYDFITSNLLNIAMVMLAFSAIAIWRRDRMIRRITLVLTMTQFMNIRMLQEFTDKGKQDDVDDEVS